MSLSVSSPVISAADEIGSNWTRLFAGALIFGVCLRNAWSTLDRYFLSDDFAYVARFAQFSWSKWPGLFVNDWSGGIWGSTLPELRPFAALTFLWDAQWWGVNPLGYHLTNFALDAGCAGFVALIAWQVMRLPLWAGTAAALVFACHPAHAEPVTWITGRVDLLGTLAYLAGFYAAARSQLSATPRRWVMLAIGAYFIGCFSKEFCVTMPIMVGGWLLVYRPTRLSAASRSRWTLLGGFVAIAIIYALCRQHAFGGGRASSHGLALWSHDYAERQMDYLRWYLTPLYNLGRDYRPQLAASAEVFIFIVLALSGGGLILWRRLAPTLPRAWRAVLFFGVCWYLVSTLPMAAASYFSPRHLYLATAGLGLAFGAAIAGTTRYRWIATLIAGWAILFSAQCFDQAVSAWRHSAKVSERVTKAVHTETQAHPTVAVVLDVPEAYEGVSMWAWATPFALQPPFMPHQAARFVEPPLVYYNPEGWLRPDLFEQLKAAPAAVLISVDAGGMAQSHAIPPERWREATALLPRARGPSGVAGYRAAWQQFLDSLQTP